VLATALKAAQAHKMGKTLLIIISLASRMATIVVLVGQLSRILHEKLTVRTPQLAENKKGPKAVLSVPS
jgi:AAA15 family ATPase/GTPase